MAPPAERRWLFFASLVAVYLTLNSVLNLTNKWVLSSDTGYGFSFPLLLTSCHMMFSFLALLPMMLAPGRRGAHAETLRKQWRGLAAVGVFMALNISLNNTSLVWLALSVNQVIRASIPVFTAALAVVVEHQVPSAGEAAGLVVLTAGVMLAVYEGSGAAGPFAVFLCVLGTVCNAAMMTFSGKLLSEKIDVLRLAFYTAPVSLLVLLPFLWMREAASLHRYMTLHGFDVVVIILLSSGVALSYNVVHSLMIQHTSAVATTVIGEAKIIGLLVLSALILGERNLFGANMLVGCAVFLGGLAVYGHFKLRSVAQRAAAQLKAGGAGEDEVLIEAVPLTVGDERSASARREAS